MLDSHCSTCNAVYQTRQELITVSELLVQLKVYVFGDDALPHKLQISVNNVTSSSISVQGHNYSPGKPMAQGGIFNYVDKL